jgi:hypothetical protein
MISIPEFLTTAPRYLFFTGKGGVGKTSVPTANLIRLASDRESGDPGFRCGTFADCFGGRLLACFDREQRLKLENLVLRQQVIVLRRTTPRKPVFSSIDRLIFVGLHRLFSNVGEALAIIKPETVVVSENAIRSAIALRARRKTLMPSFPR